MNKLVRFLFVLQYDYRDSTQASRARVLLILSSGLAVLAFGFGLYAAVVVLTGAAADTSIAQAGSMLSLILLLWSLSSLWLVQHGRVGGSGMMIGILLWLLTFASLYAHGVDLRAVIMLPLALTYTVLTYGTRGSILGAPLACASVVITAVLQADGRLAVDKSPLDDLMSEALFSIPVLIITAILLWLFAWNLQRALMRASRIVTQARITAEAGQVISRILNMDELLTRTVDLMRDRFALYHVQILLVDEARTYANLAASTGETGQALLAQGFRVPLGSHTVVSESIMNDDATYARDLSISTYRTPDLLGDVQSELAVPLHMGEKVLGALDIFSLRSNAFSVEDIEAMRAMANHLSQAFQNAQLFETQQRGLLQNRRLFLESEANLREIQRLNRQLTGQSWQEYVLERDENQTGVRLSGEDLYLGPVEWSTAMQQALMRHRVVTHEEEDKQILAVPISIRGQPIGALEVQLNGSRNQAEIRNIVQAVVERMAFSLENARLFEQAQTSAEREKQINTIAARLQGLNSIEDVLTTALSTLGQVLSAEQGTIRLVPLAVDSTGSDGSSGNGHQENPL